MIEEINIIIDVVTIIQNLFWDIIDAINNRLLADYLTENPSQTDLQSTSDRQADRRALGF